MAAGIVGKVSEKVSFATKVPMLMKATCDNDTPTPGYLYQEINKITMESFSNCHSLLDFLNERLKKSSPHVKYKALKIMTYLSANGQSEFRSALRHKNQLIRDAASFCGPMDSLQGDALNQKVRKAATELIELLFNIENPESSHQSFIMAAPSGQKMEGFGNTPTMPESKSGRFLNTVKGLSSHIPTFGSYTKTDKEEDFITSNSGMDGQFVSFGESSTTRASPVPSRVQFINYTEHTWSPSKGGYHPDAMMEDKSWCVVSAKDIEKDDNEYSDNEDDDDRDCVTVESKLVNKITEEGGIRAVPSKESLEQFTQRCSTLDLVKILKLINGRMEDPSYDVQMKCLFALEHLLRSTVPNIAAKVLENVNLQQLIDSESSKIKSKANKILYIAKSKRGASETTEELKKKQDGLFASSFSTNVELLTGDQKLESKVDLLESEFPVQDGNSDIFHGLQIHERSQNTQLSSLEQPNQSRNLNLSQLHENSHGKSNPSPATELDDLKILDVSSDKTKSLETFDPLDKELTCSNYEGTEKKTNSLDDILGLIDVNLSANPSLLQPSSSFKTSNQSASNLQPKSSGLESLPKSTGDANKDIKTFPGLNACGQKREQNPVNSSDDPFGLEGGLSCLTGLISKTDQFSFQAGSTAQQSGQAKIITHSGLRTGLTTPSSLTGPASSSGFHGNAAPLSNTRFSRPHVVSNSTLPLDLSKRNIQKRDFDFLSKPKRESAFSFVQDEIKASKK